MLHHMALFITKGTLLISRAQLYPSWFFCTSVAPWLFQHIDNANYPTLSWCKNWVKWDCSQRHDMSVSLLNLQRCSEFPDNCNILHWTKFPTNAPKLNPLETKTCQSKRQIFTSSYFISFPQLKIKVQKNHVSHWKCQPLVG